MQVKQWLSILIIKINTKLKFLQMKNYFQCIYPASVRLYFENVTQIYNSETKKKYKIHRTNTLSFASSFPIKEVQI